MDSKQYLKRWLMITVGILIASETSAGIHYDSTASLIVAVLLLSLCNVFLKPLLMLFSLPFIIMTLGLGIWFINAFLFLIVGALVSGFYVDSFGNALWGAFIVSLTGLIATMIFGSHEGRSSVRVKVKREGGGPRPANSPRPPVHKEIRDDDVIDI